MTTPRFNLDKIWILRTVYRDHLSCLKFAFLRTGRIWVCWGAITRYGMSFHDSEIKRQDLALFQMFELSNITNGEIIHASSTEYKTINT